MVVATKCCMRRRSMTTAICPERRVLDQATGWYTREYTYGLVLTHNGCHAYMHLLFHGHKKEGYEEEGYVPPCD